MKQRKLANINIDVDTLYEDLLLTLPKASISKELQRELIKISYNSIIPRVLDWLDKHDIKANFMIIGRDAQICPPIVKTIHCRGHEIGNHTYNHRTNLTLLSKKEQEEEVKACQEVLLDIIGVKPKAFRAPGYTITSDLLRILYHNDILIDVSVVNSIFYIALKHIYRSLVKNKKAIIPSNISIIRSPKVPYFPGKNLIHQERHNKKIMEFPISNSLFTVPLITGLLLHSGCTFAKIFTNILNNRDLININIHILEFCKEEDLKHLSVGLFKLTNKYIKIGHRKRMEFFDYLINRVKSRYHTTLLSNIYNEVSNARC